MSEAPDTRMEGEVNVLNCHLKVWSVLAESAGLLQAASPHLCCSVLENPALICKGRGRKPSTPALSSAEVRCVEADAEHAVFGLA